MILLYVIVKLILPTFMYANTPSLFLIYLSHIKLNHALFLCK